MQDERGAAKTITASRLYDFVTCEHRVALDLSLPRSQRTEPDEATRLLLERGNRLEAEIAAGLPCSRVQARPDDPAAAFAETVALMKSRAPLLYQGVLLEGRYLAIPDLLRRVEGESRFGSWHYIPGDIKAGFHARTGQVFQVVFAAHLLESIQERRPAAGFLILGDGSEETFEIDAVHDAAMLALERLEAIADGTRPTFPFYSSSCARCRWSGTCLPELERGPDLSLIAGMTPSRKRILLAQGMTTLGDVASLDADALIALASEQVATDGLRQLQKQAEALATGRMLASGRAAGDVPAPGSPRAGSPGRGASATRAAGGNAVSGSVAGGSTAGKSAASGMAVSGSVAGRKTASGNAASGGGPGADVAQFLLAEWNPLGGGAPFLLAWSTRVKAAGAPARRELVLAPDSAAEDALCGALVSWIAPGEGSIAHFGSSVPRALDWLGARAGGRGAALAAIERRLVNLAPLIRRGAYLPVRKYVFTEVAAALRGRPLPPLGEPDDAPFVWAENLRLGAPGDWEDRLRRRAWSDLDDLAFLAERLREIA